MRSLGAQEHLALRRTIVDFNTGTNCICPSSAFPESRWTTLTGLVVGEEIHGTAIFLRSEKPSVVVMFGKWTGPFYLKAFGSRALLLKKRESSLDCCTHCLTLPWQTESGTKLLEFCIHNWWIGKFKLQKRLLKFITWRNYLMGKRFWVT